MDSYVLWKHEGVENPMWQGGPGLNLKQFILSRNMIYHTDKAHSRTKLDALRELIHLGPVFHLYTGSILVCVMVYRV